MIRLARASDYPVIHALVQAAFERPDEAALVAQLREAEDTVFELVTEEDGQVVAHVLYSRLWADRSDLYVTLAPLAVHPSRQGVGLGSALMRASLETAREFGCHGVLLLGNPAYYGRFGFSVEAAKAVTSPYSHLAAFQVLALEESAFETPMTVTYPDAFSTAPTGPR